jgi:anti-anti-sigma factor
VLVRVCEEVDHSGVIELRDAIAAGLDQKPDRLVIDLAAVHFFKSAGLAELVQAHSRAAQQGAEVVLVCPGRFVRVLQITGLLELFTVVTSAEEALRTPQPPESPSDAAAG